MLVVVVASEMAGYVNVADEADRNPLLQGVNEIVFISYIKQYQRHFQNNIIVFLQGIQLEREEQGVEGLRGELLLRGAQRRHLLQRAGDARAPLEAAPEGGPAALQLQARRQAQATLQAGAQDAAIQVRTFELLASNIQT